MQPRTQSDAGPFARGIADIRARIDRNKQLADGLRDAVTEHVLNIGEFIYDAYGQKEDPGRRLVELKKAYEGVRTDVMNGLTGQVWQALGQLGQALLDCTSDSECLPAPQYQVGQSVLKGINVLQQIGWESARLETTLGELRSYEDAILRDTKIEQLLEQKNADLTLPLTDDPVLPSIPPGVDLSALDDAVLMDRWLDLGNRAFASQTEEDRFYGKFPILKQFKAAAETHAPITEFEAFMARCGSIGANSQTSGAGCPQQSRTLTGERVDAEAQSSARDKQNKALLDALNKATAASDACYKQELVPCQQSCFGLPLDEENACLGKCGHVCDSQKAAWEKAFSAWINHP